jgi:ribosome-associated heat shock protein Hsp15
MFEVDEIKRNIYMSEVRLDKYLWAVRVFKTRSDAADAIRNNRVLVNDAYAKPSREVKEGDIISVKKMPVTYRYKVLELVSSRQGAKNVPQYCLNITPQEELDKLTVPRETIFVFRERGTGRPTKKERREIDALMDGFYFDEEELEE